MTRAHSRHRHRPTVSTRLIGDRPDQIEVRTACRHGVYRIGYQLGPTVTERVAVCAAIAHHACMEACQCMTALWPRCRTPEAPADLAGLVSRFNGFWSRLEAQQARQGYAVVDWGEAMLPLAGEAAS